MTTYTISGYKSIYQGENVTSISEATFSIVLKDSIDSFSYAITGQPVGPIFPSVKLDAVGGEAYGVLFDGVSDQVVFSMDIEVDYLGFLDWGVGNRSYFVSFNDGVDTEYVFQLGGDAVPGLGSIADFEAFGATITDGGAVETGVYAPGNEIAFDSFTNVVVTKRDIIRGSGEAEEFHGGAGWDKIFGAGGDDVIFGDGGRDKIFAGKGKDKVFGGNGNDKLFGAGSNDEINGGKGNDYLDGGAGRDRLNGGKGDDFHYGDAGRDTFVFSGAANQGDDEIGDFQSGVDVIEIGGTVRFANLTITADGEDTLISWRKTTVTLLDTDVSLIDRDDFSFV